VFFKVYESAILNQLYLNKIENFFAKFVILEKKFSSLPEKAIPLKKIECKIFKTLSHT